MQEYKGETLGDHLRNLLTPYQNLVCVFSNYLENPNDEMLIKLKDLMFQKIKNGEFQKDIDRIIEFSESEKMESILWRNKNE